MPHPAVRAGLHQFVIFAERCLDAPLLAEVPESESVRALIRFCTESARALKLSLFSESARIESVRCLMRSSESATAKSHLRKERPIDQYACRASFVQPMKSPPIIVSRLVGNAADDGSDTLTTGVCPPMNGNVTSYT